MYSVPSSGMFVHFSQFFFFDLVIIFTMLQLVACIFAAIFLFSKIFEIQCLLLLHVIYNLLMHFLPSGHLCVQICTCTKTAIKSSYKNIFSAIFHKSLKQLKTCSKLPNSKSVSGF